MLPPEKSTNRMKTALIKIELTTCTSPWRWVEGRKIEEERSRRKRRRMLIKRYYSIIIKSRSVFSIPVPHSLIPIIPRSKHTHPHKLQKTTERRHWHEPPRLKNISIADLHPFSSLLVHIWNLIIVSQFRNLNDKDDKDGTSPSGIDLNATEQQLHHCHHHCLVIVTRILRSSLNNNYHQVYVLCMTSSVPMLTIALCVC